MPGAPRPDKKLAKIAYRLLKIPKDNQQETHPKATDKQKYEWFRDSSTAY